jgi:hypothetical protein
MKFSMTGQEKGGHMGRFDFSLISQICLSNNERIIYSSKQNVGTIV